MRAVPGAVADPTSREDRSRLVLGRDPVAGIGRIGITAIAVVGDQKTPAVRRGVRTGEVIATEDVGLKVLLAEDTGVDHRHDHTGTAGAVPSRRQVDTACTQGRRRLEVPHTLDYGVGVEAIVGLEQREEIIVYLDLGDRRIAAQTRGDRFGLVLGDRVGETEYMGEIDHRPAIEQVRTTALRQAIDPRYGHGDPFTPCLLVTEPDDQLTGRRRGPRRHGAPTRLQRRRVGCRGSAPGEQHRQQRDRGAEHHGGPCAAAQVGSNKRHRLHLQPPGPKRGHFGYPIALTTRIAETLADGAPRRP